MARQWLGLLSITLLYAVKNVQSLRDQKVFLLPEKMRHHLQPVLRAFHDLGVYELRSLHAQDWYAAKDSKSYDIIWSYEYSEYELIGPISPHHKINHLPGSYALVSKGHVYQTQLRLQKKFGVDDFNFIPQQYRLPEERERFLIAFDAMNNATIESSSTDPNYGRRWLIKNQDHRGVHFFSGLDQLDKYMHSNAMVAKCIEPLLISGHKFDIGLYVAISSIDPLRIYIYHNALLRMCKLKYPRVLDDTADLESYVVDDYLPPWEMADLKQYYEELPTEETEGTSHYEVLKKHLDLIGIDSGQFHKDIYGAVVKIIAGNREHFKRMEKKMRQRNYQEGERGNFFEIYRFDFLVDDTGKPWLMEVNQSPNLAPKYFDSGTDAKMKTSLVHDLLQLIGVQSPNEASQPNNVIHMPEAFCERCQNRNRVVDTSCWRCPGWFTPNEANVLFESTTEFHRRGRYQLVFPAVNDTHVKFVEDGLSMHDHAFSRYIKSYAHEKLDHPNEPIAFCMTRAHCNLHGNCVNGKCVCEDFFQGEFCEKQVQIVVNKANVHARLVDKINSLQSANLRVVGAATPSENHSTQVTLILLFGGNAVALCAIYYIATLLYEKKSMSKKQ